MALYGFVKPHDICVILKKYNLRHLSGRRELFDDILLFCNGKRLSVVNHVNYKKMETMTNSWRILQEDSRVSFCRPILNEI